MERNVAVEGENTLPNFVQFGRVFCFVVELLNLWGIHVVSKEAFLCV